MGLGSPLQYRPSGELAGFPEDSFVWRRSERCRWFGAILPSRSQQLKTFGFGPLFSAGAFFGVGAELAATEAGRTTGLSGSIFVQDVFRKLIQAASEVTAKPIEVIGQGGIATDVHHFGQRYPTAQIHRSECCYSGQFDLFVR